MTAAESAVRHFLRDDDLSPAEQAEVLDLGMRLGEASGALTGLPVLNAAVRLLAEMATFEEAGISRG